MGKVNEKKCWVWKYHYIEKILENGRFDDRSLSDKPADNTNHKPDQVVSQAKEGSIPNAIDSSLPKPNLGKIFETNFFIVWDEF